MKRRGFIGLAIIALAVLGTSATAAEDVRGHFDGLIGNAGGGNSGSGAMALAGWAVADTGIRKVIILVDGEEAGTTIFGLPRPDVSDAQPGFVDSAAAGWTFRLNSTDYANGEHQVWARAVTQGGSTVDLWPARTYNFNNNTSILVPFGRINVPHRNAELVGVCDPFNPNRRYSPITGWVLDLGVETGDTGIGYVELLVNGAIFANTRNSCTYLAAAGGLSNCYGLPRLDIERYFPFAFDTPNAGFRFVLDVGYLIDFGFQRGSNTLTVRAGDISNQVANVDEIQVNFRCIEDVPNEPAYGRIEIPRPGQAYAGKMHIVGWTVDWEGVSKVKIYIDGQSRGLAAFGVGTRPSVLGDYSGFPDAAAPVFRKVFDTTKVSDGSHTLVVRVIDAEGNATTIGKRSFIVDNSE